MFKKAATITVVMGLRGGQLMNPSRELYEGALDRIVERLGFWRDAIDQPCDGVLMGLKQDLHGG